MPLADETKEEIQVNAPEQDVMDFVKESRHPMSTALNAGKGIFIPLALVTMSVLLWVAFQTVQLIRERANLDAAKLSQETLVQNSQKLRAMLDALATETARLAQSGNKNAQIIVQELKNRGVTINSSSTQDK